MLVGFAAWKKKESSSSFVVVSHPRFGRNRVLSAPERPASPPQFTFGGQFPGVPRYPHPDRLPCRHLLRHLCVSGGHHGQLLPCFYRPLLPAAQQRRQRRRGGRKWLMQKRKKETEIYNIQFLLRCPWISLRKRHKIPKEAFGSHSQSSSRVRSQSGLETIEGFNYCEQILHSLKWSFLPLLASQTVDTDMWQKRSCGIAVCTVLLRLWRVNVF